MPLVKAAVCHEFGAPLVIEEVFIDGGWGGTLPAVYGHEAAGRITALGDGVTGRRRGAGHVDPLVWDLHALRDGPTCAMRHRI